MQGIFAIFRKEMEDHFSSIRFLLISALIVMVGVIIASVSYTHLTLPTTERV